MSVTPWSKQKHTWCHHCDQAHGAYQMTAVYELQLARLEEELARLRNRAIARPLSDEELRRVVQLVAQYREIGSLRDGDLAEFRTLINRHRGAGGIPDDPEWDGTDAAHPAYWRGEEDGVKSAMWKITEILDHGARGGAYSLPEVQRVVDRIDGMRNELESLRKLVTQLANTESTRR
jgi:hypothetical protein